jgi:ribonuclease E
MSKELFVSSTPRETKLAIVEEDQLAEIYFERENEYTLAGSIYKGRVTRVLPGMQSAFVNIGLERDAFLYVSDFLLEEEEDSDELEQAVSRARVIDVSGPQRRAEEEPHVPGAEPVASLSEAAGESGGEPTAEQAAAGEEAGARHESREPEDREGARKWRGRRRRRGRGRFQEQEDRADRGERPERMPEATPASRVEAIEPRPAQRTGQGEALILPGESISKYQPHSAAKPAAEPEAQSAPRTTARPSTEYSLDAAPFSPNSMVLPGESLSKYRGQSAPPPPPPPPPPAAPAFAPKARQEPRATAAEEAGAASPVLPPVHETQEERGFRPAPTAREEASHGTSGIAPLVASAAAPPQAEASLANRSTSEARQEPPFEEHAPETADREPGAQAQQPWAAKPSDGDAAEPAGPWAASPGRVVEEEEIEEEEIELPGFEEDADLGEYEELEEEVMGQDQVEAGREVTEAVREAHVNERASGGYEAEGLESEESEESGEVLDSAAEPGEEEEDQAEEFEESAEGTEDLEGARAEHRASAGTAGYQQTQRTDRRPGERRGGRRPGRRNMRGRRHYAPRQLPAISDLLKEGQEILVQIAKEPIAKKGARITSHIALPGRYLVYMPTVHHTGVSRKIASEEERHRLKRIVLSERGEANGGFIVRTAAAGANEDDLRADIRFLINLWNEIRGRAESSKAPALIYHDLNLVERILRDQVTTSFSAVWVDTEQEYERILRFVSRFQPSLVKRVKLYSKETPLFEQFNITDEINKALKSKVWLKSGGYIVINQTEALVAIDVNTGKYVGKTARLEDTIVRTNIDAIREIVRQIRLRDLGGIIVIDFIDMDERKNRQKVMQALEEALRADRAPSKVLQFNDFGLVAITRKRVKQSLERTLGQPCPTCQATGMIKSVTTVCNEIYVEMRKMSRHFERDLMLRVNPEVAQALKANGGRWVQELEELTGRTVLVKSDPLLHPEHFDIQ